MINKLVIENLKHRPVRTLLSILAIGIQVTMVLTLVGLSTGMLEEQARRYRGIGADIVVRAPGSSAISLSVNLNAKLLDLIAKKPHVVAAAGVLIESTGFLTTIHGVDLDSFNRLNGGFRFLQGSRFQDPDDIIIDSYYAREHNLRVNDRTQVMNRSWRVRGIFEPGMLARLVVPLATLQKLYSSSNQVTVIYVKADNQQNIPTVVDELRNGGMSEYQIVPMEEYVSLFSVNSIPMLKQFIYIVIGLGVLVGFLVVFLSMYTAVLERTREIGILKALGASPWYVVRILLRETFVLAVVGSIVGILIAFGTRWIINDLTQGPLIQAIVPLWWPIAAAIAIVGALLGAAYPGLKAARQNAIEALSYE